MDKSASKAVEENLNITDNKIKSYASFKSVSEVTVSTCPTCSGSFVNPVGLNEALDNPDLAQFNYGKAVKGTKGAVYICPSCFNNEGARNVAQQLANQGGDIRAIGTPVTVPPELLAAGVGAATIAIQMRRERVKHNNWLNGSPRGDSHDEKECYVCKTDRSEHTAAQGDPYWSELGPQTYCRKCKKMIGQNEKRFTFKDGSAYCDDDDCGQQADRDFNAALADENNY